MAPRPRAHAASKSILHVRLTDRERGTLRRAAASRGCKDFELVRSWIEAADAGALRPAEPPAPAPAPGEAPEVSVHAAAVMHCGPGARWRVEDVVKDVAACQQLDELIAYARNFKDAVDWSPEQQAAPRPAGTSVDESMAGRARWLVDLVEQLLLLQEERAKPVRLPAAVALAVRDLRASLGGAEPLRPSLAALVDELVVGQDLAALEELGDQITDALVVVRRRAAAVPPAKTSTPAPPALVHVRRRAAPAPGAPAAKKPAKPSPTAAADASPASTGDA
jgi:hypothetical protein